MPRNLNDDIHGDRAKKRGFKAAPVNDEEWLDFEPESTPTTSVSSGWKSSVPKAGSSFGSHQSCFHSHPAMKLPGTELVIYGGSCSRPVVSDADVYIGFDYGMKFTQRHWPWKKGVELLFEIPDMGIPAKPEEFKKLVAWTRKQLEAGLKVHCGCIGGHGRTGTFLAALVSDFGEKDAITYVRKNYCVKAVESAVQVTFLSDHFGVTKAEGHKEHYSSKASWHDNKGYGKSYGNGGSKAGAKGSAFVANPLKHRGSIWEPPVKAVG